MDLSTRLSVAAALAVPCFLLVNQGPRFWIKPRFGVHRLTGFAFLIQYCMAWYLFLTDYPAFKDSPFPYMMSATLLIQVTSAIYYFRFLPKSDGETADPGMYSDKGVLPYDWVKENLFFALLLTFANIYYHDFGHSVLKRAGALGFLLEVVMVFFAFELIRPLFPKTHLRNAFVYRSKTTSVENRLFYDVMTWLGKIFYMISKHEMGAFLQYVRFVDGMQEENLYWIRWWMLMNIGIHNIGTFVHTLRFKGLIGPRLGFSIYLGYWAVSNYAIYKLLPVYLGNGYIFALTTAGLLINFVRIKAVRLSFQVFICAILIRQRLAM